MAKGDTTTITVRTPTGVAESMVVARTVGSKLVTVEPRANEPYLAVEEQNRNGGVISRALYAKGEVLMVLTGRLDDRKAKK